MRDVKAEGAKSYAELTGYVCQQSNEFISKTGIDVVLLMNKAITELIQSKELYIDGIENEITFDCSETY